MVNHRNKSIIRSVRCPPRRSKVYAGIPVLIHTCDTYRKFWDGWFYWFRRHWDWQFSCNVFFINETRPVNYPGIQQFKTQAGTWSDRLIIALNQFADRYIIYLQEDVWLTHTIKLSPLLRACEQLNIDALRMVPVCLLHSLEPTECTVNGVKLQRFKHDSKYLMTHHPSIWRREFFLSQLLPGESPWRNEKNATRRMRRLRRRPRIYLWPARWFNTVSHRGKMKPIGKEMQRDIYG